MGQEIELKLRISPQDAANILERFPLSAYISQQAKVQTLQTTYYDTSDHDLLKQKIALRLRQQDKQFIQTVKTAGCNNAGIQQRQEWETMLTSPCLDLAQVEDHTIRQYLLDLAAAKNLQAIFTTVFQRTSIMLTMDDNLIEFALDEGEIRAGAQTQIICEIELELKKGNMAVLQRCAQLLEKDYHVTPDTVSKAQRGYQLLACR